MRFLLEKIEKNHDLSHHHQWQRELQHPDRCHRIRPALPSADPQRESDGAAVRQQFSDPA